MQAYDDGWSDYPDVRDYLVLDPGESGALRGMTRSQLIHTRFDDAVGWNATPRPGRNFFGMSAVYANGYGARIGAMGAPGDFRGDEGCITPGTVVASTPVFSAPDRGSATDESWDPGFTFCAVGEVNGFWEIRRDWLDELPHSFIPLSAGVADDGGLPPPVPNVPPPPIPGPPEPGPGPIQPAGAKSKDNTLLYVGGALVGLTVVGLAVWALS